MLCTCVSWTVTCILSSTSLLSFPEGLPRSPAEFLWKGQWEACPIQPGQVVPEQPHSETLQEAWTLALCGSHVRFAPLCKHVQCLSV
jgi:hypothetical protein